MGVLVRKVLQVVLVVVEGALRFDKDIQLVARPGLQGVGGNPVDMVRFQVLLVYHLGHLVVLLLLVAH